MGRCVSKIVCRGRIGEIFGISTLSISVDAVAQPMVVSLTPGMGRATGVATL